MLSKESAAMNSKRTTIWFLAILIVVVLGFALLITLPFLRPVAFAIILAVVFQPLHRRVLKWVKGRNGLASLVSTLAIVFFFALPVFLILLKATNEGLVAAQYLTRKSAEQGGFAAFATGLTEHVLAWIGRWVDISTLDVHSLVTSGVQRISVLLLAWGATFLGRLAEVVANAFLTIFIVFFLLRDGRTWAYRAASIMPLSAGQVDRLYRNVTDTMVANVYGILAVGLVQGTFTGVGVAIAGLPSPLLLGLAAFFASVIPVVGAALVWAPAGLYLISVGSLWKGIFLLLWGALVISTVDNFVRPWVVSGRSELHPLVLLFFILGGVQVFGFLGIFLGPVVASVLAALFSMLREELAFQAAASGQSA